MFRRAVRDAHRVPAFTPAPRAGTPAPQCGTGVLARQIAKTAWKLAKLHTGAEAPACLRSASPDFTKALSGRPRRRWFTHPLSTPRPGVPVVSVVRTKHLLTNCKISERVRLEPWKIVQKHRNKTGRLKRKRMLKDFPVAKRSKMDSFSIPVHMLRTQKRADSRGSCSVPICGASFGGCHPGIMDCFLF